jgi:hypothetical protein
MATRKHATKKRKATPWMKARVRRLANGRLHVHVLQNPNPKRRSNPYVDADGKRVDWTYMWDVTYYDRSGNAVAHSVEQGRTRSVASVGARDKKRYFREHGDSSRQTVARFTLKRGRKLT